MCHPSGKVAVGTAHSKIILIGEHAVVYGKPAIAIPFPALNVMATVEECESETVLFDLEPFKGPLHEVPEKMRGIALCIEAALIELNQDSQKIKITIRSEIPLGRGLGSSAALAIAVVRGLYEYFGENLEHDKLMSLVNIAETYAHGNPSGIDMVAASSEQPIWFKKGCATEPLTIGSPFYIVVADTGRMGATKIAVDSIRDKMESDAESTKQSIELLGKYTYSAREALKEGNIAELGMLANFAQKELDKLGVSDEGINQLVQAALTAGAYGAKLTGGGRGGCIIAIANDKNHAEKIQEELLKEGAKNTWYCKLENNDLAEG